MNNYKDFLSSAIKGRDIVVEANHEVIRSYMHADKLVESLLSISLVSNPKCPIYNVGSDKVINLKDLTKKIGIMTNKKISVEIKKSKKFDYYIPSITKAKKELNLKISISLNEALNSTIKTIND